jgi:hypothetical protein
MDGWAEGIFTFADELASALGSTLKQVALELGKFPQ